MGEQVVEERVEGKHVTVLLLDPERLTGEPIFEANRPHGAQAEADGGAGPRAPVLVVVLMWGFLLFAVRYTFTQQSTMDKPNKDTSRATTAVKVLEKARCSPHICMCRLLLCSFKWLPAFSMSSSRAFTRLASSLDEPSAGT